MNAEVRGGTAEIDEEVKSLWVGKWFWPILEDLEKLRKAMEHLFPEANAAIKDDAPNWVFRTVWACALDMADYTGIDLPQNINARRVGMMVGTQCSICETFARAYQVFKALNPEQIRKIDAVWGIGFSHESTEFYREFAEKWTPLVRDLKRKAINLALEDGSIEEVDYLSGYMRGNDFMVKVREKMREPKHKREKDAQARNCVFLFAMVCGRTIEDEKEKLSWPELHQEFLEAFDYKVDITEDAFKKILSRAGLGIGKAGRRVSDKIGTPKNLRCP